MKKILLILTLAVALLFQSFSVFAAGPWDYVMEEYLYEHGVEEANGEIYYTPGTNNISRKIKLSMDLGLIEHYVPGENATRNDIKKVLNKLFGGDFMYEKYFKEGTEGIALTVDEALIILMDAAGYGPYIEMTGNSSAAAYYAEAVKRDVFDNVNYKKAQQKFTVEQFYTMFYNVLTIPTFEQIYSNKEDKYQFSKENTLLSATLGLRKVTGIVTANSYTALNGGHDAGKSSVKINGIAYKCEGVADADSFLGYKVDAYVDNEDILHSIAVDERTSTMLYFNDKVEVVPSNDKNQFSYYDENNKVKTLKLDSFADVLYNHVAHPGFTAEDFDIKNGYLQFIDHDGDDDYDVVFIYEYTSFMPRSKYAVDWIVVDQLGNRYDLGKLVKENAYRGIHSSKGDTLTFDDINARYGLSLLLAPNSNEATEAIRIEETTYEGKYEAYDESNAEPYTIGENTYQMAELYKTESRGSLPHDFGDRVLIYLDQRGKIIKSVVIDKTLKYAYIRNIGKKTVLKTDVQILMFTEDGQMETYEVADKLTYKGNRISEAALMDGTAFELYDPNNGITKQLVRYKLNAEGEVVRIDIARQNNEAGAYNETDDFELNYDYKLQGMLYYADGAVKAFGSKYRLDKATTKIFNVPEDDRAEYYSTITITDIWENNQYNLKIYDVDEFYNPGAMVIMRSALTSRKYTWNGSSTVFIRSTGTEYDRLREEPLDYVNYLVNDWERTVYAHPEWISLDEKTSEVKKGGRYDSVKSWKDLRAGDVIEFAQDSSGFVTAFSRDIALDFTRPLSEQTYELVRGKGFGNNAENAVLTENTFYGEDVLAFARVMKKNSQGMVINAHSENDFGDKKWNRTLTVAEGQLVNFFNYSNNTSEVGKFADVQEGDFVFVKLTKSTLKLMAVYRP